MRNKKKNVRRYLATGLLSVSLLTGMLPYSGNEAKAAAVFSDTYKTLWAAPSIENLYKKGQKQSQQLGGEQRKSRDTEKGILRG